MIQFRNVSMKFDSSKGGEQTLTATVLFDTAVTSAEAVLKGWKIGYSDGDHHLLFEEIAIKSVTINLNQVAVEVTFGLRDSSGNWDDAYDGYVNVLVAAVVADAALAA
jgi:hypothetical protein